MTEYPEHEKLKAIQKESQAIGSFLEWLLSSKNIRFVQLVVEDPDESDHEVLVQINLPINDTLAEYFEIDQNKLEQEKRQMLDELRKMNSKKD